MIGDRWVIKIREFRDGDEEESRRLVQKATMSTILPAFYAAIFYETTIHLIVLIAAIMFVYIGTAPIFCLLSVPLALAVEFLLILAAHHWKAYITDSDMYNVREVYLSSEYTCFFVAEAIPPLSPTDDFIIVNEDKETSVMGSGSIIGTVAIVQNKSDSSAAWMRRMAVAPEWQRKRVASALVDRALDFCRSKGYQSVELVTTECHSSARSLYQKKGFQLRQLYHKKIASSIISILMYEFTYALPRTV